MDSESLFEPSIKYLQDNWTSASFNSRLGVYSFVTEARNLSATVKGIIKFEDFRENLEIQDTVWLVSIAGKDGENVKFTIDVKKYSQPYWWAHYQRPSKSKFYCQEDLYDIAHFITNVWTRMYLANKRKYGSLISASLAGFNFV